nr:evi5-like protein [Quercus suber]
MPPRIPLLQCFKNAPSLSTPLRRPFSSTSGREQTSSAQRRKHREPWQVAQAKAKKAANVSRRGVLQQQRAAEVGDPVRGNPTAFVQSFDTAQPPARDQAEVTADRDLDDRLNFFLSEEDLKRGIANSEYIYTPAGTSLRRESDDFPITESPEVEKDSAEEHDNAKEALRRISSLSLASNADLHRINTQRIINIFGRHNTDKEFEPRPAVPLPANSPAPPEKIPRVGVDTGSSEVQIAILTAKIKALADFKDTRGRHDKNGKRNLRLLVHRRQRLLRYLERKERGGPRFQNVVKALGLTRGAWVVVLVVRQSRYSLLHDWRLHRVHTGIASLVDVRVKYQIQGQKEESSHVTGAPLRRKTPKVCGFGPYCIAIMSTAGVESMGPAMHSRMDAGLLAATHSLDETQLDHDADSIGEDDLNMDENNSNDPSSRSSVDLVHGKEKAGNLSLDTKAESSFHEAESDLVSSPHEIFEVGVGRGHHGQDDDNDNAEKESYRMEGEEDEEEDEEEITQDDGKEVEDIEEQETGQVSTTPLARTIHLDTSTSPHTPSTPRVLDQVSISPTSPETPRTPTNPVSPITQAEADMSRDSMASIALSQSSLDYDHLSAQQVDDVLATPRVSSMRHLRKPSSLEILANNWEAPTRQSTLFDTMKEDLSERLASEDGYEAQSLRGSMQSTKRLKSIDVGVADEAASLRRNSSASASFTLGTQSRNSSVTTPRRTSGSSSEDNEVDWSQLDKNEEQEKEDRDLADGAEDESTAFLLARLEQENAKFSPSPQSSIQKVIARERSGSRPPSMGHLKKLVLDRNAPSFRYSLAPDAVIPEDPPPMTELEFWAALVQDYPSTAVRLPTLTTSKIRAGIPPPLRGVVWSSISGARDRVLEDSFDNLVGEKSPYEGIINKDVGRSFPGVELFRDAEGEGQRMLGRVLKCFSLHDKDIGYCQGLGFLVGPLLMNMGEKEAFCVLVRLMDHYALRPSFLPSLSGLHMRIYQFSNLLKQHHPRLSEHFVNLGVEPAYISQWFLSCFAVTCPLSMLFRIYDVIFAEGANETVMRVALALIRRNEEKMLASSEFEEVMQLLLGRAIWDSYGCNADDLVDDFTSLGNIITHARLAELEREFDNQSSDVVGQSAGFLPDVQAAASRFLGRLWPPVYAHTPSKSMSTLSPPTAEKDGSASSSFHARKPSFLLRRSPSKQSISTINETEGSSNGSNGSIASTAPTEIGTTEGVRDSNADMMSLRSKSESIRTASQSHTPFHKEQQDLNNQIEDLLIAMSEMQREHAELTVILQQEREDRSEDHRVVRQLVKQLTPKGGETEDAVVGMESKRRTLPPPERPQTARQRPMSLQVGLHPGTATTQHLQDLFASQSHTPFHKEQQDLNNQIEDLLIAMSEMQREHAELTVILQQEREDRSEDHRVVRQLVKQLTPKGGETEDAVVGMESKRRTLPPPERPQTARQRPMSLQVGLHPGTATTQHLQDLLRRVEDRLASNTRMSASFETKAQLRSNLVRTREQLAATQEHSREMLVRLEVAERSLPAFQSESDDLRAEVKELRSRVNDEFKTRQRLEYTIQEMKAEARSIGRRDRLSRISGITDGPFIATTDATNRQRTVSVASAPTSMIAAGNGLRELKLGRDGRRDSSSSIRNMRTRSVMSERSASPPMLQHAYTAPSDLPKLDVTASPDISGEEQQPETPFSAVSAASSMSGFTPNLTVPASGFGARTSSLATQEVFATPEHESVPEEALLLELVNAKTAEAQAKQEVDEMRRTLSIQKRRHDEILQRQQAEFENARAEIQKSAEAAQRAAEEAQKARHRNRAAQT